MGKRNNPNVDAYLTRRSLYLLLLLSLCAIPFAVAQRSAIKQSRGKRSSVSRRFVTTNNALPANIIVVTNTNDSGPGSLRQALADANNGDTIDATGVSGTILLTSGELQITHSVTINGPGADNLAVDGNGQSLVFNVNPGKNVAIDGLTVTNDGGGGIYDNQAALTVSNCTVSGNSAGGTSNSNGTLTLSDCTVSGNSGDGIVNDGTVNGVAAMTLSNCTGLAPTRAAASSTAVSQAP